MAEFRVYKYEFGKSKERNLFSIEAGEKVDEEHITHALSETERIMMEIG